MSVSGPTFSATQRVRVLFGGYGYTAYMTKLQGNTQRGTSW